MRNTENPNQGDTGFWARAAVKMAIFVKISPLTHTHGHHSSSGECSRIEEPSQEYSTDNRAKRN